MALKNSQPSEFELQILGVLWENGPHTVRQVMEHLTDGKKRAYTSVLSVMQVMHKKGLVKTQRKRDGLAHVYEPKVARDAVVSPMLKGLVDRVFGGRTSDVVQNLLDGDGIDQKEIDELRCMLDALESRGSNVSDKS